MKIGDIVRVLVDADTYGDAMDSTVPYIVRDMVGDDVYVQREDESWFAGEYEWCVLTAEVCAWKRLTRDVA